MSEHVTECPICHSEKFSLFITCKDYTVSHKEFRIVRCNHCDFLFTNPRPTEEEIGKYYQSESYISHSNTSTGVINTLYQRVRKHTLQKKVALIDSLFSKAPLSSSSPTPKVLDIGCGTGHFLKTCKDAGWDIFGTEPDPTARDKAITETQSLINADFLTYVLEEKIDVITLWHVLEHIHPLEKTIEKLYQTLSDTGHLIIAVPNPLAWDAQKYQQYWAAYDLPRHLYHFTPPTMNRLLNKVGFKIVDIKPMLFDAYYVSLLSTKYRTGKTRYWEAFINGFRSNQWASKNHTNYSSLIYIIQKDILPSI